MAGEERRSPDAQTLIEAVCDAIGSTGDYNLTYIEVSLETVVEALRVGADDYSAVLDSLRAAQANLRANGYESLALQLNEPIQILDSGARAAGSA